MPKVTIGKRGIIVKHYRSKVYKLYEGHRDGFSLAYTYARSTNQAGFFLGQRFPYPTYLITEVEEAG